MCECASGTGYGTGYGFDGIGEEGFGIDPISVGTAVGGTLIKGITGLFGGGGGGQIGGVSFGKTEYTIAQTMLGRAASRPFEIPTIAGNFTVSGKNTYSNDERGVTVSKSPAGAAKKLVQALGCSLTAMGRPVNTNKAYGSPGGPKPVYQCAGGRPITEAAAPVVGRLAPVTAPPGTVTQVPLTTPPFAEMYEDVYRLPVLKRDTEAPGGMPGWVLPVALGAVALMVLRK